MSELTRKRAERLVELMGEGGVLEVEYGPDGKGHEAAGCGVTSDLRWTFRWWCSFLDGPGQGRVEPYHTPPRADDKGLRDLVKRVVAELPAPPDPRLANLPDELRAVAEEFLTLHGAWDTDFEVWFVPSNGVLQLMWGNRYTEYASFSFVPDSEPPYWSHKAYVVNEEAREKDSYAAGSGPLPLRRSHDFAEFMQRFRGGSDATL